MRRIPPCPPRHTHSPSALPPSGGCAPNRRRACVANCHPRLTAASLRVLAPRFGPKQPFKGAKISGSLHMTIQVGSC